MSDYAVIATGGKQYRVRPGDTISIEKIAGETGSEVVFDSVLLASVDGSVKIGAPNVKGAAVKAEIAGEARGPKLVHYRFKNKTHGGTKRGHRQHLTAVTIKEINVG